MGHGTFCISIRYHNFFTPPAPPSGPDGHRRAGRLACRGGRRRRLSWRPPEEERSAAGGGRRAVHSDETEVLDAACRPDRVRPRPRDGSFPSGARRGRPVAFGLPRDEGRRGPDARRLPADRRRTSKPLAAASPRVAAGGARQDDARGGARPRRRSPSEENLKNLPRIREIARKLADPRGLSDAEVSALVREGKVVVLVTCNIHSTEIGSTQMAMEWAHDLATAEDPVTLARLDERRPPPRPVGQPGRPDHGDRVVPEVARHEVRGGPDAVALPPVRRPRRQPRLVHADPEGDEGRLTRAVYHEWLPQVWLDEHQMGWTGPRIFMPPVLGAGRPRHPPARLARREPHRREHGAPARAGRQSRASSTATPSTPTGPAGRRTPRGGRTSPAS